MSQQQIDIKQLDIVTLKALAWDLNQNLVQTQKNLEIVLKELNERNQNTLPS